MVDVKKLTNFLKSETEFLKDNDDYAGAYLKLDDTYSVVLSFEDGFYSGDNDVIHSKENPRFALVAAIRITNPDYTPDMWEIPHDKKSGDLYLDDYTVSTNEDFEGLAQRLINDYEYMTKELQPLLDREEEVEIEDEVEEACGSKLKESTDKYLKESHTSSRATEVFDSLLDEIKKLYEHYREDSDHETALRKAIKDTLFNNFEEFDTAVYDRYEDILALAGNYMYAEEIYNLFKDDLYNELYVEFESSVNESAVEDADKKVIKKVTSELDDWDDIKPLDITDEDLKF